MLTKLKITLMAALAATTLAGAMTATPAAARDGRNGAFIGGLLLGGIAGGALAQGQRPYYSGRPVYSPGYYDGQQDYEPTCWIERRPLYNHWGDVVRYRRVRICE